ncbi:WW domain binding protein 11-domain-containing protein [Xylariaceae sp. FL0255]|nr:WW domain binding protein 11-domain-containing protein [Xylariaceae sp. FL0255]
MCSAVCCVQRTETQASIFSPDDDPHSLYVIVLYCVYHYQWKLELIAVRPLLGNLLTGSLSDAGISSTTLSRQLVPVPFLTIFISHNRPEMPKERNFNPVQAQRKADKAKAIKKGKAEVNARRNEKLAKRNPDRLQKQIDDLKQITSGGGKLTQHEESVLQGLERDLKAVNKAREALGDRAPTFGRSGPRHGDSEHGVLGKRRRDRDDGLSSDDDVPEDVKSIPMPRDTPPPISKEVLDKWYAKRRASRNANANDTPLGERNGRPAQLQETKRPPVEAKTVYEAQPMVRNLQKEAVSAFVPSAVRAKLDKSMGQGGLMEPEEADRLEREGYLKTAPDAEGASISVPGPGRVTMEEVEDEED